MDSSSLFKSIVEGVVNRLLAYSRTYSGTVEASSNGTVDVSFDDAELPGLCGIPIWDGTPGVTAEILPGTKVTVGFHSGNQKLPYAIGWKCPKAKSITVKTTVDIDMVADAKVKLDGVELDLGGSSLPVARQGDVVNAGGFTGTIVGPCSTKVKAG